MLHRQGHSKQDRVVSKMISRLRPAHAYFYAALLGSILLLAHGQAIFDDNNILGAAEEWCEDSNLAREKWGSIENWDTSRVTNVERSKFSRNEGLCMVEDRF